MLTDSEQMKKSKEDDMQALSVLVGKYERLIFRVCYRVLGNSEDALEAAQATMVRAWDKRSTFDEEGCI